MTKDPKPEAPKIELATQDWTLKEITDVERRIEKAFHDQTKYLDQKYDNIVQKMDNNTKWMIGLVVTMTVAIIVAVLFQG